MTLNCHILFDRIKIRTTTEVKCLRELNSRVVDRRENTMQISRLFEIVYLLLNKKTTTAKELAEHFEVSQRTIYRDIEILCQSGIPIYATKGKGGGIGLMDRFILNKSVLSEQEQNDILTALKGIQATSYLQTDHVLSKLSSLFGNNAGDWIEVDFSYWNHKEEDNLKFQQLKEAILNRNVIEYHYFNSYGRESHRTVEPRKLIFKGQAWYLYGFCREKKEFRYFKISRMTDLKVSQEVFEFTPLPDTQLPMNPEQTGSLIHVVFKIDAEMAYRIYDEFPSEAIERKEDGAFLIHSDLLDRGWLYSYIMSYEDHIEVIVPAFLREEIIHRYQKVLKKYNI